MAATDAFYRDQKFLNRVFAISSVAMLVTVVWMFADDFRRPYKQDQRVFRTVEEELSRRTTLAMAPSADAQAQIVESEQKVVEARARVNQLKPLVDQKLKSIIPERAALDFKLRSIKADYDSRMSYYNIAVEHKDPDAQKHLEAANEFLKQLNEGRPRLEALETKITEAHHEPLPLPDGAKMSLAQAQKELKELEGAHKKLTGDFDRFLKLAMQKQWTWKDSLRALPVLDAFAAPIKIKQTFHEDLPIDYGGFKYVTRYDRCTTCHLGIDKPGLDVATLTRLSEDPAKDSELKQQTANAQQLLLKRQEATHGGTAEINVLAERDLEPKQVKLDAWQIRAFAAHPRLDLFVDANSPHAAESFGCTICHQGQGSATSFFDAAHTPNDAAIRRDWEVNHHWHAVHTGDWEFPMLPSRFIEASCVKCHHQIEDLVLDGTSNEAQKLVKGYHLVKDLGCFGCHEISGTKSGRAIGPDMRLEPEPPLDSLSPSERMKRLADTANPPGTLRKVGPSLNRIAEKTNADWAMKWIKAPRAFKPDTKMPHFYLQANNVDEALPPEQKKFPDAEIRAVTHYLFAKSAKYLTTAKPEAPLDLPAAPIDDDGKKAQLDHGRQLFATKGCMACHQHHAMETAGQTAKGEPAPALVGESYFGPELSGVASKVTDKKWLVQWLLDPTKHSPRTLMPNVHLTTNEADDIATWLLAQQSVATPEWATLKVDPADRETLSAMARAYLQKAGLTTREQDSVLKDGFTAEELKYRPADADEHELAGPLDDQKLLTYIGKKAISNLGCYACHTIPGFESAKPIGVALNDWGKKDVDRIAYEDAENYVRERFHEVLLRDDPKDPSKPAADWKPNESKMLPLEQFAPYTTAKQPPYEKFFSEMLVHGHRLREGFLSLKLMSPRTFDYNRVRDWNDRARMPQFKFARIRRLPDESDEAFQIRLDREEAIARDAVMTFVLGMIAEPIPPKFLPSYSPERMAEVEGRKVIEKFNCNSCHLIRPGIYDLTMTNDIVHDAEGKTIMVEVTDKDDKTKLVPLTKKRADLERLNLAHSAFMSAEQNDPKDHPYPEHNAWVSAVQTGDRITVHGVRGESFNDTEGNMGPSLRPSRAVTYKDADGTVKSIPANPSFGIPFFPQAMTERGAPYNGIFALQLKRYLSEYDPKVYGDVQPLMRYDDEAGKGPDGYAAIPPALLQEGERVQPDWLYQFLLNPTKVRKIPPLMMPKFSLSEEEASALVDYFVAANKLDNPGIGLATFTRVPQRNEEYLRQRTKEYVAILKENKIFDSRVIDLKPLWARVAREQMTAAERRAEEFRALKDDAKAAEATKEVERWRAQIASNDFPTLQANWEEREAYVGDAWKLVTYAGNLCITCHQVGPALPNEYRAPDLDLAWERLRPEWTKRWIAYPQRLNPYASLMQPQYKVSEAHKHFEDAKVFIGGPDAQIRASRDLLMMYPMVADWPIIKYRVGPAAFGPPAPTVPAR